jgi:hypothetical protein
MTTSCEHGNEPSCSIACWEFLVDMKNYLIPKTYSVLQSYSMLMKFVKLTICFL